MEKLNFDDMDKVSGGKLSISERNGKFRVYKEYDKEFATREEAENWLNKKAERCLDKECGAPGRQHSQHGLRGPENPSMLPPPPSLN